MSKEKRQISEYWETVIAIFVPALLSTILTGGLVKWYLDHTNSQPASIERPPMISTFVPPIEPTPTQIMTAPTLEQAFTQTAHLFYMNGQYLVCNPVEANATRTFESLSDFGIPQPPFRLIINGKLFEPEKLTDPLFPLMGKDDFACLSFAE